MDVGGLSIVAGTNISPVNFVIPVISLAWSLPYFCHTLYIINTAEQTTLIEPTGAGGGKLNFVLKL